MSNTQMSSLDRSFIMNLTERRLLYTTYLVKQSPVYNRQFCISKMSLSYEGLTVFILSCLRAVYDLKKIAYEPKHKISNNMVCATSKASDQLEYSMSVKLLPVLHFEFLCLKGGCTGSHESTPVKMPHCWKSYVMAHIHIEMFTSCLYIFNLSRKSLIVLRNNFSACDIG